MSKPGARPCNCAERTGELVVFTCPVCIAYALPALESLTKKGYLVQLDKEGSVSASVEVEEFRG